MRGVSAGGQPVSFTSTSPELNACSAVEPSVMIFTWILSSLTFARVEAVGVLRRASSDASCCHCVELERAVGDDVRRLRPLVAVLRRRPPCSPGGTRCATICCTNHGCGEVSVTFTVVASGAVMRDLALQRVALLVRGARLAAVVLLRALDRRRTGTRSPRRAAARSCAATSTRRRRRSRVWPFVHLHVVAEVERDVLRR